MKINSKLLIIIYIATGFLALGLTWLHIPHYMGEGLVSANTQFWADALVHSNPAGKFLTIDILFFALIANIWMVIESRKHGIKYVWAYIAAGVLIAISFAFPLFLAAREWQLASNASDAPDAPLKVIDILGLVAIFAIVLGTAIWVI